MTPRVHTTGNDRPYIVAPGYQRTPRLSGKLLPMDRPEGELSLGAGTALLIGLAIVVTLLIAVFGS